MLLGYANATPRGLDFLDFLDDELTYKTLFVPVNEGFVDNMVTSRRYRQSRARPCSLWLAQANRVSEWPSLCPQTLSGPDLELHASNATLLSTNVSKGTLLPSHSGLSLVISDVGPDNSSWAPVVSLATARPLLALALTHPLGLSLVSPQAPGAVVVSDVIVWDIIAFNGIIHALASPLLAPPQPVSWWGGQSCTGKGTTLARSLIFSCLQRAVVAPEVPPVAAGVGAVVAAATLLGLVAGAIYFRARGRATGFGFSAFQVGLG